MRTFLDISPKLHNKDQWWKMAEEDFYFMKEEMTIKAIHW